MYINRLHEESKQQILLSFSISPISGGKNGNFISRNSCGGDVYFSGFMFVVNRASCLVGSFKINETSYITDKLSEL